MARYLASLSERDGTEFLDGGLGMELDKEIYTRSLGHNVNLLGTVLPVFGVLMLLFGVRAGRRGARM
jgi:hypothetical protein